MTDLGPEFAAALAKLQGELSSVPRDSVNPHFKSRFASLHAIHESIRPLLAKHGFSVIQGFEPVEAGSVGLTTIILHVSGEAYTSTLAMPIANLSPQGVGSAITYARRYALSAALGIVSDDDDDAEVTRTEAPTAAAKPQDRPALYGEDEANPFSVAKYYSKRKAKTFKDAAGAQIPVYGFELGELQDKRAFADKKEWTSWVAAIDAECERRVRYEKNTKTEPRPEGDEIPF